MRYLYAAVILGIIATGAFVVSWFDNTEASAARYSYVASLLDEEHLFPFERAAAREVLADGVLTNRDFDYIMSADDRWREAQQEADKRRLKRTHGLTKDVN